MAQTAKMRRDSIECVCESADFDKYPVSGHKCDRCPEEATVAVSFDDGDPRVWMLCETDADRMEAGEQ